MAELLDSVNRVRYAGLDFQTHVDAILSRLQTKYAANFNDFVLSDLAIMLVDLVSFGLDTLSFYLDRRATDSFLETARSRRSVARLSRQLGYKMRSAIASSVSVQMSILDAFAVPVVISPGYQFQTADGVLFQAAQQVTFNVGEVGVVKDVPCYQGESFTETFVSDGTPNQVFEFRRIPSDRYLVSGYVSVLVDGTPWTENEFLLFEQTNQYEVGYNDDPPTLRFGDGVAGNVPLAGATITATYVVSLGRAGRVARNTITQTAVPLVVLFQTLRTSVTNADGAVGGDDPETLDETKRNAPRVFKTRQVAVTREDYESLGNAYADPLAGKVAVAQAVSSRSAADDLYLQDRLQAVYDIIDALDDETRALLGTPTDAMPPVGTPTAFQRLFLIGAQLSEMTSLLSDAATETTSADGALALALTAGRTVRTNAQDVQTNAVDALTRANTLQGIVSAISTGGSDQLTTGTKASLLDEANRLQALVTQIQGSSATILTEQSSQTTQVNNARGDLETLGVTPLPTVSLLALLSAARSAISAQLGDPPPTPTELTGQLNALYELLVDATAVANRLTEVRSNLDDIYNHVDRLLAADCKANLVTVPILARDKGGFYAAPSNGLIGSLQAYLDARKEVTQTVEVVTGESFLVLPRLRLRVGVRQGYSLAVMDAAVRVVVDNLLRDRRFGVALYVSDVSAAVLSLEGVAFVNVDILGWRSPGSVVTLTEGIDTEGNLIIQPRQVISKDLTDDTAIEVTVEVYTGVL